VFTVWMLFAVNWRRAWPVLAAGGWLPLVLLGLMAGYVWSRAYPSIAILIGFIVVPNVVWQVGAVGVLIGIALFCGWLQTHFGWYPPDVDLEPPAHGHGHHGHEHDHAHHAEPAAVASHNGHPAH
jgi:hypothetical protein